MKRKTTLLLILSVLIMLNVACSLLTKAKKDDPKAVSTIAAQTLEAIFTATSQSLTLTPQPTEVPPTATKPLPSSTPLSSATATKVMPTATNTAVPLPCNQAKFVTDVTIPDGTQMKPNQSFVKTWRITNAGSCTWTSSYQLIFSDGERMSAPGSVSFPGNVSPGSTVDLSVQLTSPGAAGSYTGKFLLKAPDGSIFGVGDKNSPVTAVIKVVSPTPNLPEKDCLVTDNFAWVYPNGTLEVEARVENTGSKTWPNSFKIAAIQGDEFFDDSSFNIPALKTGESFLFQVIGYDPQKGAFPVYITWAIIDPNTWERYCQFHTDYDG